MQSRRERIKEALEEGPRDLNQLARITGIKVKTLTSDIEHIKKSLKNHSRELFIEPPYCYSCEKTIRAYQVKNIRKCPKCKSENVKKARFFIK